MKTVVLLALLGAANADGFFRIRNQFEKAYTFLGSNILPINDLKTTD